MPSTSHARCRKCGGIRHKVARLNLCRTCWLEEEPSLRQQWRDIKARRAARRFAEVQQLELAMANPTPSTEPEPEAETNGTLPGGSELFALIRNGQLPDDRRAEAIATIQREGVPPMGTPERALYMTLFVRHAEPDNAREALIERLYTDSDAQLVEIYRALDMDQNELDRVRRRRGFGYRQSGYLPSARLDKNEELQIDDGQAYARNKDTGLLRALWSSPLEVKPPDPFLRNKGSSKVADPSLTRRGTPRKRKAPHYLDQATEVEVARLYGDPSIPVKEIQRAYNISSGLLFRILERQGTPHRSQGRPVTHNVDQSGHFKLINGKQTWIPGALPAPTPLDIQPLRELASTATPSSEPLALGPLREGVAWRVEYTMQLHQTIIAPTLEEAIARFREANGWQSDGPVIDRIHRD